MFKVHNLLKTAIISLALAAGTPAIAHASHITHISHPRANMMFSSDSVYYPSPRISKVPSYELSQIQGWSGHSASGAVIGQPVYVKPYLKTHIGHHEWYKFVKPSFKGDDPVTGWIPDYGLTKYSPKVHHWTKKDEYLHDIYVFNGHRYTSSHPVTNVRHVHTHKHSRHANVPKRTPRLSKAVMSDLYDAKVSQKYVLRDEQRVNKAKFYVKNDLKAARMNAKHDKGAQRTKELRLINHFKNSLK